MSIMLPPTAEFRKECSVCYQLLYVTHWSMDKNLRPIFTIGSSTPTLVEEQPATITVKAFCPGCNCEATREYIQIGDTFRLMRESFYQEAHPGQMMFRVP